MWRLCKRKHEDFRNALLLIKKSKNDFYLILRNNKINNKMTNKDNKDSFRVDNPTIAEVQNYNGNKETHICVENLAGKLFQSVSFSVGKRVLSKLLTCDNCHKMYEIDPDEDPELTNLKKYMCSSAPSGMVPNNWCIKCVVKTWPREEETGWGSFSPRDDENIIGSSKCDLYAPLDEYFDAYEGQNKMEDID